MRDTVAETAQSEMKVNAGHVHRKSLARTQEGGSAGWYFPAGICKIKSLEGT